MKMLDSASEHYRRQQRITALGLAAARRARKRLQSVAASVAVFQVAAAQDAAESVPRMLAEQGIDAPPEGSVNPRAFSGTASDGRPLASLLEQAATDAAFDLIVATQIQDAARAAAGVGIAARPGVNGYIRMLNPPSCSRCAVLAGKFFRWNAGFARHPRCDCRHVPSSEDLSRDLRTDPKLYFESLGPAEQNKIFTNAGAQAVRDGADIGQVVNARRGMSTAARGVSGRRMLVREDVGGGQGVFVTREGITRRGMANRRRTGRNNAGRLMPESIYEIAGDDRDEAIRLLRLNGYIF